MYVCMYVCMYVWDIEISSCNFMYGFLMENSRHVFFSGLSPPVKLWSFEKLRHESFLNSVSRKVLTLETYNLCQLIEVDK